MVLIRDYTNAIITHLVNFWIAYILMILSLLFTIAFYTLAERKFMGALQRRKGPDVVGFWGLLQAIADGVKLVLKEIILPYKISMVLFLFGPSLVFFLSLCGWIVIPFSDVSFATTINYSLLFVFVTSGFNIYGLVLSGWSSNSRYAFLGGIRATAQMISYELVLSVINLFIFFLAGSFNLTDIVKAQYSIWFILPLFPVFIVYLIVMLAETNRTPFDLAEAEAELVAGYNVEYSSITFALFFLGEYANMIFLSFLGTIYFLGGWSLPYIHFDFFGFSEFIFICKILVFCMFFIWIRATLPRYRYDQLMELAWKSLLPVLFGFFLFLISFITFWKFWAFTITVWLVLFVNIIQMFLYIMSKIHITTETVSYNISYLAFQSPVTSVNYSIINPFAEVFKILNEFFFYNNNYSGFFQATNKTKFNQQIIHVPVLYFEPFTDLQSLMYNHHHFICLNYNNYLAVKKIYINHPGLSMMFTKFIDTYLTVKDLDSKIRAYEVSKELLDPIFDLNLKTSLINTNPKFRAQLHSLYVDILNAKVKQHFKVEDLSTIPFYKIMEFVEYKDKNDFDKALHLYIELDRILPLYRDLRKSLITEFFDSYIKPLYAPFWLVSSLYETSLVQTYQIFPINMEKTYYGHILSNQVLINQKYI